MQEINRAIEAGTLNEDQWQFSAKAKPVEEFYDTRTDPFEIHNQASDPRHVERMSRMRTALEAWIQRCNDPLDMPEDELVRSHVYPPNGEQPVTAAPVPKVRHGRSEAVTLTITCDTHGASIGYRVKPEGKIRRPWKIYTKPVEIRTTGPIEIVAHRIGFKPSERVVIQSPH